MYYTLSKPTLVERVPLTPTFCSKFPSPIRHPTNKLITLILCGPILLDDFKYFV